MRHIKLFEEFLNEEDPLAALTGGEEAPKEDPLEKKKKEQKQIKSMIKKVQKLRKQHQNQKKMKKMLLKN